MVASKKKGAPPQCAQASIADLLSNKTVAEQEPQESTVAKKRGRKPKNAIASQDPVVVPSTDTEEEVVSASLASVQKARSKKQASSDDDDTVRDPVDTPATTTMLEKKIKIYTASFADGVPECTAPSSNCQAAVNNITSEDEQVILQLKVHERAQPHQAAEEAELLSGFSSRIEIVPTAYNSSCFSADPRVLPQGMSHATKMMVGANLNDDANDYATASFGNDICATPDHATSQQVLTNSKLVRILMDFEEKSKVNEWPSSTSVACYWCCHKFNSAPFGLPVKYSQGKYNVCGCFCSLECAAAWNFSCKESIDDIYERYSLLNMLSNEIGHSRVVKPAPDRTCLAMFGGHMSIEEFRMHSMSNKLMLVNFPPMMSLTQQVEEINDTELRSEYKFIPIDQERVHKYQEKIKLKRSKPLVNFKNTLDSTMNLRYH